jgi:AI-2 transport protein TqsA
VIQEGRLAVKTQTMNATLRNEQIWLAVCSLMLLAAIALAAGLVYTRAVMIPFVLAVFIVTAIESTIRRYIATKLAISAVTGLLVWGILAMFGLHLAFLFGMPAFLLNFIPSIGSIIATFLPIPVAVAQFQDPWPILAVVALPGAVQMSIGNVIEPKLMGDGVKLHPVAILLSLTFWGLLWGPVGMILAVPITATIRIVMLRFQTTKPVAELLAGRLPESGKPAAD